MKVYTEICGYPRKHSYIYHVDAVKHNIKIKVMSTLHSYTLLEQIVYDLQSKGAIVDPCVVDDLITCINTTKRVEYNKVKI
jgi:hypothetical protein